MSSYLQAGLIISDRYIGELIWIHLVEFMMTEKNPEYNHTHTHRCIFIIYIYTYIHIYVNS